MRKLMMRSYAAVRLRQRPLAAPLLTPALRKVGRRRARRSARQRTMTPSTSSAPAAREARGRARSLCAPPRRATETPEPGPFRAAAKVDAEDVGYWTGEVADLPSKVIRLIFDFCIEHKAFAYMATHHSGDNGKVLQHVRL